MVALHYEAVATAIDFNRFALAAALAFVACATTRAALWLSLK
jgi:hypothetical protein